MASVSDLVWDDTAQRLCWLARQYAFLFGEEFVGTEHLLLAAAEVTPHDWHGYSGLTRDGVLNMIEALQGKRGGSELGDRRPRQPTPRAREAMETAAEHAVLGNRAVSIRDIWIGLLPDEEGLPNEILSRLGVAPMQLRKKLTEPSASPDHGGM
jgi:hypothetical protein